MLLLAGRMRVPPPKVTQASSARHISAHRALHVAVVGLAVALEDLRDGEPAVRLDAAVDVQVLPSEPLGHQPPGGSLACGPVADQHHVHVRG